ncbi:MAG: hypothetical protein AAFW89_13410 [Bacteroidota bacterium]
MLSSEAKEKTERVILAIAIVSYLLHLVLIVLATRGVISIDSTFVKNPIAAIYTPFSFILVYEVYLLVYFLPKSISFYIGKQYEIITLIVIRRIFKDIAQLELSTDWFYIQSDLQFTYDVLTSLVLFVLIYFFYRKVIRTPERDDPKKRDRIRFMRSFINLKKVIAVVLIPILFTLAVYTFFDWFTAMLSDYKDGFLAFKNINNIFFDEFFTILIVVDVLLLLASFYYSDEFHKIIRNSGFVISTILIKVSFSVDGVVNNALVIGAVLFGFLILIIHNLFEQNPLTEQTS